eukprot:TRINITY_DN4839_c0_g1_i2.p1 TRINITY_DN4839_c0_g1~~TRINITY_DN4839_c0_g1_i2.p1  ORF type:complete len:158 (-),score=20.50 TRINITY_DN4839_c0_g1_i2:18-491(-)
MLKFYTEEDFDELNFAGMSCSLQPFEVGAFTVKNSPVLTPVKPTTQSNSKNFGLLASPQLSGIILDDKNVPEKRMPALSDLICAMEVLSNVKTKETTQTRNKETQLHNSLKRHANPKQPASNSPTTAATTSKSSGLAPPTLKRRYSLISDVFETPKR